MARRRKPGAPPKPEEPIPRAEVAPLALKPVEENAPGSKSETKPTGRILQARPAFVPRAQTRPLAGAPSQAAAPAQGSQSEGGDGPASPAPGGHPSPPNPGIPDTRVILARFMKLRVRLLPAVLAFLVILALACWSVSSWTASAERKRIFLEISKQGAAVSKENQVLLDAALMELRNGDAQKALDQLIALERNAPEVASLAYLVAVAAMQAGQPEKSVRYADRSIARRERVSDALAIKAVLETQSRGSGFGDPKLRAEAYLQQAIVADAANASPLVELASLLRYRNRNEEALGVLQAARSRLNPVDSHSVVDTSLAILSLQEKADADLPNDLDPDKDIPTLYSAAYVAMRTGDFGKAAGLLKTARERLPADLYYYLVNDPALRKYVRQKELEGLYQ